MWIKLNAFALAVRVARLLMLYSPPSSLQNPECPECRCLKLLWPVFSGLFAVLGAA